MFHKFNRQDFATNTTRVYQQGYKSSRQNCDIVTDFHLADRIQTDPIHGATSINFPTPFIDNFSFTFKVRTVFFNLFAYHFFCQQMAT